MALNPEDTLETADGLVVTLRRGKTDQEAEGRKVAIPRSRDAGTCPERALSAWLAAAGIATGPLFRRVKRDGQIPSSNAGLPPPAWHRKRLRGTASAPASPAPPPSRVNVFGGINSAGLGLQPQECTKGDYCAGGEWQDP